MREKWEKVNGEKKIIVLGCDNNNSTGSPRGFEVLVGFKYG